MRPILEVNQYVPRLFCIDAPYRHFADLDLRDDLYSRHPLRDGGQTQSPASGRHSLRGLVKPVYAARHLAVSVDLGDIVQAPGVGYGFKSTSELDNTVAELEQKVGALQEQVKAMREERS